MIQEYSPNFDKEKILDHLDRFSETRVMVIGDIILDEYIWGDVSRISPEAPVPVVEVREETRMLGGAANVINNIHALGGQPTLCGVIGKDRRGRFILEMLEERDQVAPIFVMEFVHSTGKSGICLYALK